MVCRYASEQPATRPARDVIDWDTQLAVNAAIDAQLAAMHQAGVALASSDERDGLYPRPTAAVAVQAAQTFVTELQSQPALHWPALLDAWSGIQLAYWRGYVNGPALPEQNTAEPLQQAAPSRGRPVLGLPPAYLPHIEIPLLAGGSLKLP